MSRMTTVISVGVALGTFLLVSSCRVYPEMDPPDDPSTPNEPEEPAEPDEPVPVPDTYELLYQAQRFVPGCWGFSAQMPEETFAFRDVLAHAEADELFKRLVEEATIAGRLYGVCGVYFTDCEALPELVHWNVARDDSVLVVAGCVGQLERVGDLLWEIGLGITPAELRDGNCGG